MNYTKGPWSQKMFEGRWMIQAGNGHWIAEMMGGHCKEGDATLIAAAPDLLRELHKVREAFEMKLERFRELTPWETERLYCIKQAIAKAEGKKS